MSFVFYDTETTGLSKPFDQIVHFAAIRTDQNLRELERFEVRSRLRSHVIPHPEALCISGVGIDRLIDRALPSHYDMACRLQAKLSAWSPSIFAGYNSIRFDEELLRQTFYQTLHPVYLTSLHQNGRSDVMGLVLSATASSPNALVLPRTPAGRPTFKLADIARANGVQHSQVHDAMSDTEVALELCRRLRQSAPAAWQSFVRFSNKGAVAAFVESEDAFLLTEFYGGEAYSSPVVLLGDEPGVPNGRLCLVLNSQTQTLMTASDSGLRAILAERPSPIRRFRTNGAPVLTPLYDVEDGQFELAIDEVEDLAREIRGDPGLCARLIAVYASRKTSWPAALHAEERIYEAFPSNGDTRLMERFHQVSWPERARILEKIDDERYRILGERLILAEAPHALNLTQRQRVMADLASRGARSEAGPLSREAAIDLIDGMMAQASAEQRSLLTTYRQYLREGVADWS